MWAFTDLVQMLVELSDYDFMAVRDLLDIPIQSIPEVLLQTLSEIHFTRGEAMLNEIYSQLFPVYLSKPYLAYHPLDHSLGDQRGLGD